MLLRLLSIYLHTFRNTGIPLWERNGTEHTLEFIDGLEIFF